MMLGSTDIRVCDSKTLIRLCKQADKYEFNRRINTEALEPVIDPNCINVLSMVLPYHRASFGPSQEPIWPDHHRCQIVTQIFDEDNPDGLVIEAWLDVEAKEWETLMTAAQFDEKMNDPMEMAIAYARAAADEEDDD